MDHTMTLVHVEVISTRNLNIVREAQSYGAPRIAVQVMIQEFDRVSNSNIYGQELWTDVRPGAVQQNFNAGEMEFRVRKPVDSKLIFIVSNLDENNPAYRFCGELRMNVSKLTPGAFAVTDTFNLDTSAYFPQRQITGDITLSIKYIPGAPQVQYSNVQAYNPQSFEPVGRMPQTALPPPPQQAGPPQPPIPQAFQAVAQPRSMPPPEQYRPQPQQYQPPTQQYQQQPQQYRPQPQQYQQPPRPPQQYQPPPQQRYSQPAQQYARPATPQQYQPRPVPYQPSPQQYQAPAQQYRDQPPYQPTAPREVPAGANQLPAPHMWSTTANTPGVQPPPSAPVQLVPLWQPPAQYTPRGQPQPYQQPIIQPPQPLPQRQYQAQPQYQAQRQYQAQAQPAYQQPEAYRQQQPGSNPYQQTQPKQPPSPAFFARPPPQPAAMPATGRAPSTGGSLYNSMPGRPMPPPSPLMPRLLPRQERFPGLYQTNPAPGAPPSAPPSAAGGLGRVPVVV